MKTELLSPAGDLRCFYAALNAGADAVYMGLPRFGARSFAGNLTYKRNTDLRQMLRRVPLDRLLLETDSPYLAPVPLRGQSNNPSFIIHTYECAAETLGMNADDIAIIIKDNYDRLTASV